MALLWIQVEVPSGEYCGYCTDNQCKMLSSSGDWCYLFEKPIEGDDTKKLEVCKNCTIQS